MIVKQKSFTLTSGTIYGFAGGIFGVVTIGFMISSQFAPDTYPSCSSRYAQAGLFALKNSSGELLNATDLQSRLGGHEWGVLHNIAISNDAGVDDNAAMNIKFNAGGKINRAKRRAASGVGFRWQPGSLDQAAAACLSYSVRVPENFKPGSGGSLPGLFGTSATAEVSGTDTFSARMRWLQNRQLAIQPTSSKQPKGVRKSLDSKLPRGEWVKIEQELVLNTPGKRNGALRVWINGELKLNIRKLSSRKDAKARFGGVIADTHYTKRNMEWGPAPKATEIKLSPMILRWN